MAGSQSGLSSGQLCHVLPRDALSVLSVSVSSCLRQRAKRVKARTEA